VTWQKNPEISQVHTSSIFRVKEKVHFCQTERRRTPDHNIHSHSHSSSVFRTKHCACYQLSLPCVVPTFPVGYEVYLRLTWRIIIMFESLLLELLGSYCV
jgi:hypothetical protein